MIDDSGEHPVTLPAAVWPRLVADRKAPSDLLRKARVVEVRTRDPGDSSLTLESSPDLDLFIPLMMATASPQCGGELSLPDADDVWAFSFIAEGGNEALPSSSQLLVFALPASRICRSSP
jgi:hypothetical protein